MGFPWRKVANVGKRIGGMIVPGLDETIEMVEESIGKGKGREKRQATTDFHDKLMEWSGLAAKLSASELVVFQGLRAEYIDRYVAYRNADAALSTFLEKATKNDD